jgi:hypothetical protein
MTEIATRIANGQAQDGDKELYRQLMAKLK